MLEKRKRGEEEESKETKEERNGRKKKKKEKGFEITAFLMMLMPMYLSSTFVRPSAHLVCTPL